MTKKIAIVGPESSGKSTLAYNIANHYQMPMVEEYARAYLNQLPRPYVQSDLIEIAQRQIELEKHALISNPKMVICDTNLVVIKIWSIYKYDVCDDLIIDMMKDRQYDLHLLLKPDLPWEADDQRENPHDRERLFEMYQNELEMSGTAYTIIEGLGEDRLQNALSSIYGLGID